MLNSYIGLDTAEQLDSNLTTIRHTLNIPEHEPLPIGVGFITWLLQPDDPRLSVVLRHRVRAIWFAFGRGAQVDTKVHVRRVRKDAPGTLVFVMVGTVEEAVEVAGEGVDGIVVQGGVSFFLPFPSLYLFSPSLPSLLFFS